MKELPKYVVIGCGVIAAVLLILCAPSCTSTRLVLLDSETKQEKTEPLYNPSELEIERYKVMCRTFGTCEVKITDISFRERVRETAERKEAGKK